MYVICAWCSLGIFYNEKFLEGGSGQLGGMLQRGQGRSGQKSALRHYGLLLVSVEWWTCHPAFPVKGAGEERVDSLVKMSCSEKQQLKERLGTSLVMQWLRIHLPMQGTQVRALVWEDPTCCGATKPMHHSYWACALEPESHNYWTRVPQLLKPTHLEPMLLNKRSHRNEKPTHCNKE